MIGLGAVVGLPVERRILRLAGVDGRLIAVAGADGRRAEAMADALIAAGASALISFGVAGGLDPSLRPGALVLASEVVAPDGERTATDAAWRARVAQRLEGRGLGGAACVAPLAGIERAATSVAEKAALRHATGAAAVDMESHGIARAARRRGVPLLVLRAVGDPASRGLPASAAAGLGADGTVRPSAVLAALLRSPGELPALIGVAADTARALAALWRAARVALDRVHRD